MRTTLVNEERSTLPLTDDHPYRTGPWQPNMQEYDLIEPTVIGEIPADLNGVYIRNTENPVHEALGRYHPFDGDAILHSIVFQAGEATYRNRFVRTEGFLAEQAAQESLWSGIIEDPVCALTGSSNRDTERPRRFSKRNGHRNTILQAIFHGQAESMGKDSPERSFHLGWESIRAHGVWHPFSLYMNAHLVHYCRFR